jgi:hypothetical protein
MTLFGCGSTPVTPTADLPAAKPAGSVPATAVSPPRDLSRTLAAKTRIPLKFTSVLDSSYSSQVFFPSVVTGDVAGSDGRIAIPVGSTVTLIVRKRDRQGPLSTLSLGLYAVNVGGREYSLSNGQTDAASLTFTEDAGAGPGHSAVHLNFGTALVFKLEEKVELH